MKYFIIFILFLIPTSHFSQNFEDSWLGYFSYVSVKSISQGNDKIYVASENAIFTYDLSTQEVNKLSTIQGLSGKAISTIYYSDNFNLLVIGYENGLIEIVKEDDENILSVVDILEKQTIPPDQKNINHFYEFNGSLYIATEYGISLYDLDALEFGDTYFIGNFGSQINITQTVVLDEYIYAATQFFGIRRAIVNNDNLIDFEQWEQVANGSFKGIQVLGNDLFITQNNNNRVFQFNPPNSLIEVANFSSSIVDFNSSENKLTVTTEQSIQVYSDGFVLEASVNDLEEFDYILQSGFTFNNTFYLGTLELGVLQVPFQSNQAQQILPDGPLNNHPFSIDVSPGKIWINFGDITVSFNPYPLTRIGISSFNVEEGWYNIPYDELTQTLGVSDINDLVYTTINPENSDEIYMSSFQKGLLKIEGQEPSILYNETNSSLIIPDNNPDLGIRIFGSDFDREGNLWIVQSRAEEGLIKVSPSGQFQKIDITDIIDPQDISEIKVSRNGNIFFGALESGLVGYNTNTGVFNKIGEGIGTGNLPSNNIRALTFDANNRLWIGTLTGLRVLNNVGGFFEDGANIDSDDIIIFDEETGVAQELLFEQSITDIEVDGSNNKWISTSTSGVFLVSSNGQETIQRFTVTNSPLPSNNVQDIAIDDSTGIVYFATKDGLVAFKGSATAPRDDLESVYAFPNPVRPEFFGNVTIDGLTANANVKITDITGSLVFETTSQGGSVLWDTTAFGKYKVASGVYLVLVTTEDALETKVSKIMIIR